MKFLIDSILFTSDSEYDEAASLTDFYYYFLIEIQLPLPHNFNPQKNNNI